MPLRAVHSPVNWSSVKFATTMDEVTCGSAATPPSHVVAGIGVSGSELPTTEVELPVLALVVGVPLHAVDATHRRPESAAERSAWLAGDPHSKPDMHLEYHMPRQEADVAAWRQVKRMASAESPLFTCRVGIHHRVIFRVAGGELAVLSTVHRKDLDGDLKRHGRIVSR
jgi:hypothetical protein